MNQKFDNYQFLQKYFQLQNSIMFDCYIELGEATIAYSETDTTENWNIALVNSLLSDSQISKIQVNFAEINRKPTLLFQNTPTMQPLVEKITTLGYKKNYEDSFQFWQGGKIDTSHFESVKKVETPTDLALFLTTFDQCYQNDDPQNPYGKLGNYLKVAGNV